MVYKAKFSTPLGDIEAVRKAVEEYSQALQQRNIVGILLACALHFEVKVLRFEVGRPPYIKSTFHKSEPEAIAFARAEADEHDTLAQVTLHKRKLKIGENRWIWGSDHRGRGTIYRYVNPFGDEPRHTERREALVNDPQFQRCTKHLPVVVLHRGQAGPDIVAPGDER
jgi:hypothetical protein